MPTKEEFLTLGIIPARGGSKGVPRKNIRPVGGQPLIAYAICAAKKSKLITTFVTSTDDEEIASVSRSLGSAVCMRSSELAADDTPMVPVVQHVLAMMERQTEPFDYVALLQPTAPQRTASDIDAALGILIGSDADSVVSVYQVEDHHPTRMYRQGEDGRLVPYAHEPEGRLRQDLEPVFHRNGAIYACRRRLLEPPGTLIGHYTLPYIMPRARSINIDDELDLLLADLTLTQGRKAYVGQDSQR